MSTNPLKRPEVKEHDHTMVNCMRCHGRKKLFKIMGGYSHADTGGVSVDCPMCLGKGKIKPVELAMPELVVDDIIPEPLVISESKIKSKKSVKEETMAGL